MGSNSTDSLLNGQSEQRQVWTMVESSVYHEDRDCPALNRSNRYRQPRLVPFSEATSRKPYRGCRVPCKLCAVRDA